MTIESPAVAQPRSVHVDGDTIGACELAARLRTQGLIVTSSTTAAKRPLALVTTSVTSEVHLDLARIESIDNRRLGEEDWLDEQVVQTGLNLARPRPAPDQSPERPDGHTFVVGFDRPKRHLQASNTTLAVAVELVWNESPSEPQLHYLSGEHLDEFSAVASIASGLGMTSLALFVPLNHVVDQSAPVVDILWRLLDHPGVRSLIPEREPDLSVESLVRTKSNSATATYGSAGLNLSSVIDLQDHRRIDGELARAAKVADLIAIAASSGRWTGAFFSRIALG